MSTFLKTWSNIYVSTYNHFLLVLIWGVSDNVSPEMHWFLTNRWRFYNTYMRSCWDVACKYPSIVFVFCRLCIQIEHCFLCEFRYPRWLKKGKSGKSFMKLLFIFTNLWPLIISKTCNNPDRQSYWLSAVCTVQLEKNSKGSYSFFIFLLRPLIILEILR